MKKIIVKFIRVFLVLALATLIFILVTPDDSIMSDESEITDKLVEEAYNLLSESLDTRMNGYFDVDVNFTYGDNVYSSNSKTLDVIGYKDITEYSV